MSAQMEKGDVVKYVPTSTVGRVADVKTENGDVWVKLDVSGLYYKASTLEPCDRSEYRTASFKERRAKEYGTRQDIEDLQKMEREVDVSDITPSGGG